MPYTDAELEKLMRDTDKRARRGRLERLRFLLSEEDSNMFPADALALEYYEEARLCWYVGAFVAAIVMSQLALEEVLRSYYRAAKGVKGRLNQRTKVDEASFADLIAQASCDGVIGVGEADLLTKIRKEFRNPYVHTRDTNDGDYLVNPTFLKQYFKIYAPHLVGISVEDEAKESIRVLVKLFPVISRRAWGTR